MKIVETTFERLPRERLEIGFKGENLRATVRIDCASVFAEYPNATPTLIVKPLFADAYPVVVDRNGTDVDWLITSEILSFSGDGEIQLVFYKDEVICKSAVSKIRVCRSLQVTGDMPDPVAQWIDDANRKLAEVDAQIVELEGMVDTATDAATRAEQSASTASTKAEQAAGSAATATEKATEATNAAGTATAKAAEAALSATQANNSAVSAADSERIATAKAGDATTAAGTATAKAEQATEAAQTATEKAGDASASARAAHASEINAAESADDALAAQTAAEAAKRAAEASATQAATSAQGASADAQTATQKAAEAQQSATGAAQSEQTATQKATEAAESAQAASDAKTAVEQTAEQLAESLEQIEQNTQDIAELDERKANVDGYYPDMTVGNAEQLNSSKYVENSEPYTLRTSGGSSDIGNREYLDAVVGGTLAWNQMVRDEASENSTDFADVVTVTDAVEDAAEVKVKIEPVQDLHGYDHPWPAGGGENVVDFARYFSEGDTFTQNGITAVFSKGYLKVTGTNTSTTFNIVYKNSPVTLPAGTYIMPYNLNVRASVDGGANINYADTITAESSVEIMNFYVFAGSGATVDYNIPMMLVKGTTRPTEYTPYSNICPITGWDGVKVTRTGVNIWDEEWELGAYNFNTGAKVASSNTIRNKNAISIVGGVSYAFSVVGKNNAYIFYYGKNMEFISREAPNTSAGYATFTPPDNAFFMGFYLYGTENTFSISINYPATDTTYHAYAGQTYDVTLPTEAGTVYGGELIVNADGSGSLVVDRISITKNTADMDNIDSYPGWKNSGIKNYIGSGINGRLLGAKTNISPEDAYAGSGGVGANTNGGNDTLILFAEYFNKTQSEWQALAIDVQIVFPLQTPITYTLTASEVTTLLGTNNIWADTGDLALTYTGTDEHLVLESGKKYLARLSGTDSMLLGSGQEITAAKGADNVFDLTQMFGTAVADYVYGQGAAFFRKWFGKRWYPYNAGELRHVEGLSAHEMVGFNQWDEEWEQGYYSAQGVYASANNQICTKNLIPVIPNMQYWVQIPTFYQTIGICEYDASRQFIQRVNITTGGSASGGGQSYVPSANCSYIRVNIGAAYGATYKHDICISLAHNNSRSGEYEPYEKHSYPLDSSVILRGIPKVGASGVYWDGDRYLPDGTVERRYNMVGLSTIPTWNSDAVSSSGYVRFITPNAYLTNKKEGYNLISDKLIASDAVVPSSPNAEMISGFSGSKGVYVSILASKLSGDLSTANGRSTAFVNYLANNEITIVYELATPTTETAQPYHSTQWVSDWGTEEFVSTGLVPVGHETRYPANLRDKLQHLPDAASGNGSYLITQTDGQMVLTPFPAPPSTAGNYVLKATVVNGVATYTWEVAT